MARADRISTIVWRALADTQAQLQIDEGDLDWENFGTGVISYATGPTINVTDTAGARDGWQYYRVRGTHFGQHGNVWSLPTYYSPEKLLYRQ
jgi:hypothetical protein